VSWMRFGLPCSLARPAKPDGRRRAKVQPADQVPAVRSVTPALPAPSSELSDLREQVQLVKLGKQQASEVGAGWFQGRSKVWVPKDCGGPGHGDG